jgi:hypothetical protein
MTGEHYGASAALTDAPPSQRCDGACRTPCRVSRPVRRFRVVGSLPSASRGRGAAVEGIVRVKELVSETANRAR